MLPETRYARRDGIHVAYQISGSGSFDLVLVSLWFSHLEARWEVPGFDHFLHRLGSFSRLISFDKYGIGLSDPAPPGSMPPLEDWMDDVRAVMDDAGSERAALLGAGDGGMMAATFAATYPSAFSALVLANSTARMSWAPDYPIGVPPESGGDDRITHRADLGSSRSLYHPDQSRASPMTRLCEEASPGFFGWLPAPRRRRPSSLAPIRVDVKARPLRHSGADAGRPPEGQRAVEAWTTGAIWPNTSPTLASSKCPEPIMDSASGTSMR